MAWPISGTKRLIAAGTGRRLGVFAVEFPVVEIDVGLPTILGQVADGVVTVAVGAVTQAGRPAAVDVGIGEMDVGTGRHGGFKKANAGDIADVLQNAADGGLLACVEGRGQAIGLRARREDSG